jgi:integrase
MNQTKKRIARHLYEMSWRSAGGEMSRYYYGVFRCRLKKKGRNIPLGSDLKTAKDELVKIEAQNVQRYDFDLDKQRIVDKPRDGKASPFTFAEWCGHYPTFEYVEAKRSLQDELRVLDLHLKPFFGAVLLTEITRESLLRYVGHRKEQFIRRNKQGGSKKKVSRGTISNELSLLRYMLNVAVDEGYKATVPSFNELIVRTESGGREIGEAEEAKLLPIFEPWMQRLWEFGRETCLSQGDLLRLTDDMIDEMQGTITPEGGRKKSKVTQVSPLTDKARAIYQDIGMLKRTGKIVPNVAGYVFTRNDGTKIDKGMIHAQIKKARRANPEMKKFTFHNLRNTALTQWARQGIPVDVAMKAAGHASIEMHQRYVKLQDADVANAFGTSQIGKQIGKQNRGISRK